ncbi:hypothetical protein DER44DRAFT_752423 [Fusarium oxysporum]|nr:hypothetical protein DER44DRAFT_752423 [Fusarium oxysporum]
MSVDHHSEQSSDIIVGDVTTVTTYSGDYRDQSATTNESRDEVDVTEMLSLTTQLANFSITSANLTGSMLEPPSAHDRICRKRTCHNSHHVLQHYLHGRQSYPQHCVHATLQVPRLFGVITTQSQGIVGMCQLHEFVILFDLKGVSPHSRQQVSVGHLALHRCRGNP